jgi:uncharacterized protein YukE
MAGTAQAHELASAVPAAPGVADIKVDPAKLLDVAKVVEDQANALQDKLRLALGELHIDTPSADTISVASFQSWNALVSDGDQSYVNSVRTYVQRLRDLVDQLRTAAEKYRLSEEDKAAYFGDRGARKP